MLQGVVPYLPPSIAEGMFPADNPAVRDSVALVYQVAATLRTEGSEMTAVQLRTVAAQEAPAGTNREV